MNNETTSNVYLKVTWGGDMNQEETGYVAHLGKWKIRNDTKFCLRKHHTKRPLARSRHTLKDDIKMYLSKIQCEGTDWIQLAHGNV